MAKAPVPGTPAAVKRHAAARGEVAARNTAAGPAARGPGLGSPPIQGPLSPAMLAAVQRLAGNHAVASMVAGGVQPAGRAKDAAAARPAEGVTAVQRQPDKDSSLREAVVTVRWVDDDGEVFRRLVAAIARSSGFRGIEAGALYSPVHDPAIGFFRDLAPRLGSSFRGQVRIRVTATVGKRGFVSGVTLSLVDPQPKKEPSAEDVAAEPGLAGILLRRLENAARFGSTRATVDFLNRSGTVSDISWSTAQGDGKPVSVNWPASRDEVRSLLSHIGFATHSEFLYTAQLDLLNGVWRWTSFQRIAEVQPLPVDPGGSPIPAGVDEAQAIVDDLTARRRLVLDTAAMLIREQDPTKLSNMIGMVAPFAIMKLPAITRIARMRRVNQLAQLSIPRVSQLARGRYSAKVALDPRLTEMARELRASQGGIQLRDFASYNIAVARVRVDGEVRYMDAGNLPAAAAGRTRIWSEKSGAADVANIGIHSEGFLADQVMELRRQGRKVTLEQLYSERIPCTKCMELMDSSFSEAAIFYSVPEQFVLGDLTRGRAVMNAYGVTP